LIHESIPHCEFVEHTFPPQVLISRQLPARQNSPWWHSALAEHTGLQRPPLHDSPAAQSLGLLHAGKVEHRPDLQAHALLQSSVPLHAKPGQPKRQLVNSAPSTKVQALLASNGSATKKRLRNFKAVIGLSQGVNDAVVPAFEAHWLPGRFEVIS
jgi:hypothetical protein